MQLFCSFEIHRTGISYGIGEYPGFFSLRKGSFHELI